MKKIQVLLADDHKIVRDGIISLLKNVEDIEIAAEANNGESVIGWLASKKFDIIIMDINMPILGGIETTQRVVAEYPETKVIGLSMFHEEGYITKMLQAGASGYLMKNVGKDELITAIRTVVAGESYFSEDVSLIFMSRYMSSKPTKMSEQFPQEVKLTRREVEIITLISQEFTNKEIADKLFISSRTVDTHRRNLVQKLCVKNTAGLVKFAIMKGYL